MSVLFFGIASAQAQKTKTLFVDVMAHRFIFALNRFNFTERRAGMSTINEKLGIRIEVPKRKNFAST